MPKLCLCGYTLGDIGPQVYTAHRTSTNRCILQRMTHSRHNCRLSQCGCGIHSNLDRRMRIISLDANKRLSQSGPHSLRSMLFNYCIYNTSIFDRYLYYVAVQTLVYPRKNVYLTIVVNFEASLTRIV